MGLEVFRMQSLNIDAARKLGQDEQQQQIASLETPAPPVGGDTGTPYSLNTPDILNSLISITTNPFFDNIPLSTASESSTTNTTTSGSSDGTGAGGGGNNQGPGEGEPGGSDGHQLGRGGSVEEDLKVFATLEAPPLHPSTSTSNAGAPQPPLIIIKQPTSVQSMTSQLIKDSLKHTIQSKRKNSGKEDLDIKAELSAAKMKRKEEVSVIVKANQHAAAAPPAFSSALPSSTTNNKLTPEDEERRKRRRERNKVAATKCRNKKKEKTGLLAIESETLDASISSFKTEISQLEAERQQLMDVLAAHQAVCTKVHGGGSSAAPPAAIMTSGSSRTSRGSETITTRASIVASSSTSRAQLPPQHQQQQQHQDHHQHSSSNYYILPHSPSTNNSIHHHHNHQTHNSHPPPPPPPHFQYNNNTNNTHHPHPHIQHLGPHPHIMLHHHHHHHLSHQQQSTTVQL